MFICSDQVDAKDNTGGRTALFVAAAGRHEGSVKLLLEHGADPDIKVSISTAGQLLTLEMLIEHGADSDMKVGIWAAGHAAEDSWRGGFQSKKPTRTWSSVYWQLSS